MGHRQQRRSLMLFPEKLKIKIDSSRLALVWFVFSVFFLVFILAFSWGFLSGKNGSFPHDNIREMAASARALKDLYNLEIETERSAHEIIAPYDKGGVTVNSLDSEEDTLIFMTLYKAGEFVAQIIDRQGDVIHHWKIPFEQENLFSAQDTKVPLSKKNLPIHGAWLSDNGDVFLIVEYRGLLKLDHNSNLQWILRMPLHHAVTLDADQTIWTLSRQKITNRGQWIPLVTEPYWDDQIVHLSPDGKVLDQFSVLDIIQQNQYEGILYGGHPGHPTITHDDPLHVNDIDILTAQEAVHFPLVNKGDIMISLRTISTIIIIDRDTKSIKWSMTGPFHRQHDPQISMDGSLLVFDNRTSRGQTGAGVRYLDQPQDLGYSRLLAIDPMDRNIVWSYEGTAQNPFYTSIQGKLEELPNGNIMVVEPEGGRIFELDKSRGIIVWEFINLLEEGIVGRVTQAIPFTREQLKFLCDN